MTIVQNGKVCEMNPGCIRKDVRRSWGITLANASKLLFVWEHETLTDEQGLWVNLYDARSDAAHYGGREREEHVQAIMAGTQGWALVGFNIRDDNGKNHWWIERGLISNPYRIVATRVDSAGIIWGNLKRLEPLRRPAPYRRGYEEGT